MKTFGLIGGDRRYGALAELLRQDGWAVHTFGLFPGEDEEERTAALGAEIVILPIFRPDGTVPCAGENLSAEALAARLGPGQRILAGQTEHAEALKALHPSDYLRRESMAVGNAAVTAEGAIQVCLAERETTLLHEKCLVLGFGRIGKLLSLRLAGLGARVCASARKGEDLAWIRALGLDAVETGSLGKPDCGVVFNTIPAPVLGDAQLRALPKDCLLIELASHPGFSMDAARALGLRAVAARGLPGRCAPRAAAAVLRDTIYEIVREGDPE